MSYSPTIGRFLERDPIGYPDGPNPYEFVKSSPVNFTDPYGLTLKLTGDAKDVAAVKAVIDGIKANGSDAAKEKIKRIEESDTVVTIEIVRDNRHATIGRFEPDGQIDIGDCEKFPEASDGATQKGIIIHEIVEQGARQINGKKYPEAHEEGKAAEGDVGSTRLPNPTAIRNRDGTLTIHQGYRTADGRVVVTQITANRDGSVTVVPPPSDPPRPK